MVTSVTVKFNPSTKKFGKGRIYFQIIRKRIIRQFNPEIKLDNNQWIGENSFPHTKDDDVNEKIKQITKQICDIIKVFEKTNPTYTAEDVVQAMQDQRNNL